MQFRPGFMKFMSLYFIIIVLHINRAIKIIRECSSNRIKLFIRILPNKFTKDTIFIAIMPTMTHSNQQYPFLLYLLMI